MGKVAQAVLMPAGAFLLAFAATIALPTVAHSESISETPVSITMVSGAGGALAN